MDREEKKRIAVELLGRLSEAHGAPGSEGEVRSIFREALGGETCTDGQGSIITEKAGSAKTPRILLTAHMDEVGFMVQAISAKGFLKFVPLGGWWAHTLPGSRVRILTQGGAKVVGVIGAKPPHFLGEAERDKLQKIEDMFIDVGASNSDEVRQRLGIEVGDTIVPDCSFTPMENPDMILGKALDNRVGTALTIQSVLLLRAVEHPNGVWAVGTVQEEVGARGARTAVQAVKPDAAIVLEGAPADDMPGVGEDEQQGALGRGVQIRIMDPSAIMNRKFVRHTMELAQRHGISHQVAVRRGGGTDAQAIHLFGTGIPTLVLSVPTRYIHSQNGILHMGDYLAALDLVTALLLSLDVETVAGFTRFDD